jgi:hypothetical protein
VNNVSSFPIHASWFADGTGANGLGASAADAATKTIIKPATINGAIIDIFMR